MTIVPNLSWAQVVDEAKTGRVDVLPALANTPERRNYLNFTNDYLLFPSVIVMRRDHPLIAGLADLRRLTVVLMTGYSINNEILGRYPDLKTLVVTTPLEGLRADRHLGREPEKAVPAFVQAESDTTRRFGGTGLGLVICRRIADLMGGDVGMESEPGRGTTMRLVAPLPVADPALLTKTAVEATPAAVLATRRQAPDAEAAAAEGMLVLVADDHPVNRMLIKRQVNLLGYAVEAVENGNAALKHWRSGRFGMIITDCHMPEMDGYELTRAIRQAEGSNGRTHTPIIACTANVMEGEVEACLAAGMDDYLAKPVELRALLRILDHWLPLSGAGGDASTATPETAVAANGGGEPAIDRAKLAEVSLGDESFEHELLADFAGAANEDAKQLAAALDSGSMADIALIAHRIKGASRMVGAVSLAAASERLEKAGRANDQAAIAANRDALFDEMERVKQHLTQFGGE